MGQVPRGGFGDTFWRAPCGKYDLKISESIICHKTKGNGWWINGTDYHEVTGKILLQVSGRCEDFIWAPPKLFLGDLS